MNEALKYFKEYGKAYKKASEAKEELSSWQYERR